MLEQLGLVLRASPGITRTFRYHFLFGLQLPLGLPFFHKFIDLFIDVNEEPPEHGPYMRAFNVPLLVELDGCLHLLAQVGRNIANLARRFKKSDELYPVDDLLLRWEDLVDEEADI